MQKPLPHEYNPYFQNYINLVGEGTFAELLDANTQAAIDLLSNIPEEKHNYQYAPGKWTVKEVLMHLIDTERVMSYRALVAARGDSHTPLHPMDENAYAASVDVTGRSMESLLTEFNAVRTATSLLLNNLTDAQSMLTGNAITHIFTLRSLGYIMIGHVQHHLNVLEERYL
ncbi:MAG: DinB family protein [Bacteroidota bacterium]